TLELVNSQGSVDNLAKLRAGEVGLALVQSGQELSLNSEQRAELYGLGVLFQEPVWLFARQDVTIARLGELAALRVAIGSPSSGTRSVTDALLGANGIDLQQLPAGWQAVGGARAARELQAGNLDAAFFIGPAENGLVQRLA